MTRDRGSGVFWVEVPIAGRALFYVEASSEEEAMQKVRDADDLDPSQAELEWEYYTGGIVSGNVCHAASTQMAAGPCAEGGTVTPCLRVPHEP